jgi:hypothetical protein
MLKVKPNQPKAGDPATSTARYVDEANVAGRSITLRIDDRAPLKVDDPRARRLLWQLVEHIEAVEAVQEALDQVERGEGRPAEEFFAEMREKYGIPSDE